MANKIDLCLDDDMYFLYVWILDGLYEKYVAIATHTPFGITMPYISLKHLPGMLTQILIVQSDFAHKNPE